MRLLASALVLTAAFACLRVAAHASPASAAFVTAAYQVILNRPADAAALATFPPLLDNGSMTQTQMVQTLVNSAEFRIAEVNALYQQLLHRSADAQSIGQFGAMFNAGATAAQIGAAIAGSAEYYASAGGTNARFVQKLYSDALGRAPGPAEVNAYLMAMNGGATRAQTALSVFQSAEGANHLILVLYQNAMHRTDMPSGSTLVAAALSEIQKMLGVRAPTIPTQIHPMARPTV
jgi:hypothetical protein